MQAHQMQYGLPIIISILADMTLRANCVLVCLLYSRQPWPLKEHSYSGKKVLQLTD